MPAPHGRAPRAPGPASGSLQGRNPREVGHGGFSELYGDCGFAPASTADVADGEPVMAQLRSRSRSASGRFNRHVDSNRERFTAMIGHGEALPVGDQRCDPAFRRASSAVVMTYRS